MYFELPSCMFYITIIFRLSKGIYVYIEKEIGLYRISTCVKYDIIM